MAIAKAKPCLHCDHVGCHAFFSCHFSRNETFHAQSAWLHSGLDNALSERALIMNAIFGPLMTPSL